MKVIEIPFSNQRPPHRVKVVEAGPVTEVFESFGYPMPPSKGERKANPVRKACSSLRARRMVRHLSTANGEPGTTYFFTATFADDVQDYDEALRRWKRFRRILLSEFEDLRYVCVPEVQSRSGRWHFHAVFCGLPTKGQLRQYYGKMETQDGRKVDAWMYHFTELWSQANGGQKTHRANIEVARSVAGVCGYLVKYLSKDVGGTVPVGRRNYYAGGRALRRPVVKHGKEHIPEGLPAFAIKYQTRDGQPAAFARYVAQPV